jgi:hypothetical protein
MWGWPGGSLVVLGVDGWKSHCCGVGRVEVSWVWGCPGGGIVVGGYEDHMGPSRFPLVLLGKL